MQLISPTLSNPALCSARNVRPLVWHMLRTNQCSWTPSLEMPRGELNMPKILMAKVFHLLLSRRRSSRRIPLPFSAFGLCYQSAISKRYHFPLFHCHLVYCAFPGRSYRMKTSSRLVSATVNAPKHKTDVNTLQKLPAKTLQLNEIGNCTLAVDRPIAFDSYAEFPR